MNNVTSRQIRRKERILRTCNRPIPSMEFRISLTDREYLEYLVTQINIYEYNVSWMPKVFTAVDLGDVDDCPICLDKLLDGEEVSHFRCNLHLLHSHCLVNFLERPINVVKCCPLCREENIELDLV